MNQVINQINTANSIITLLCLIFLFHIGFVALKKQFMLTGIRQNIGKYLLFFLISPLVGFIVFLAADIFLVFPFISFAMFLTEKGVESFFTAKNIIICIVSFLVFSIRLLGTPVLMFKEGYISVFSFIVRLFYHLILNILITLGVVSLFNVFTKSILFSILNIVSILIIIRFNITLYNLQRFIITSKGMFPLEKNIDSLVI